MKIWVKTSAIIIFIFIFIYVFFINTHNSNNNISVETISSIKTSDKIINEKRDFRLAEQILKTILDKRLDEGLSNCSNEIAELKLKIAYTQLEIENSSNNIGTTYLEVFNTKCYNKDIRARAILNLSSYIFNSVSIAENSIPKFNKEIFAKDKFGWFFETNSDLRYSTDVYDVLQKGFNFAIKNLKKEDEILLAKSIKNRMERYQKIPYNFKYSSEITNLDIKFIYNKLFEENKKINKEIKKLISNKNPLYTYFLLESYSNILENYKANWHIKESEESFKKYQNAFKDYITYSDIVNRRLLNETSSISIINSVVVLPYIARIVIKSDFNISKNQKKEIKGYLDKYIYTMHEIDKKSRFVLNSIGDYRDFDKNSPDYLIYKAYIYIANQIDSNYKTYLLEDIQDNLSGIEGWVESDFSLEF